MNEMNYAYAVARTRAVEKYFLGRSVVEQLISADSLRSALRILADNGWEFSEDGNYTAALNARLVGAWDFLCESAPDKNELEVLTVLNDYQNLKTAIKCKFSGADREKYFFKPTSLDLEVLGKAVDTHNFTLLPDYMEETAKYAYKVAVETDSGQLTDTVIDSAALRRLSELSASTKNALVKDIARLTCAGVNVKVAMRCAKTHKDDDYIRRSLCECEGFDVEKLVSAALSGEQAVLDYVSSTQYSGAADALSQSTTAFEKWCDDVITALIKKTKWQAFGLEPLIAHYYGTVAEVKSVRIILGAKQSGVSAEIIQQRVRELYV